MSIPFANAIAVMTLCFVAFGAHKPAFAGDQPRVATIEVSATGSAQLAPDMAIVNLNVVREASTAREALDANNKAMAGVIDALSGAGIDKKDLQTSRFNIQPRYETRKSSSAGNRAPKIVGYGVTNALTVRIRDLKQLGTILDLVVTLGVNSGGNVRFTNDDPSPAITRARIHAMKNAISKAKTLAEGAGVSLGDILKISEIANNPGPVPVALARASFKAGADAAVPVAGGENSYQVSVNVSWKIIQ